MGPRSLSSLFSYSIVTISLIPCPPPHGEPETMKERAAGAAMAVRGAHSSGKVSASVSQAYGRAERGEAPRARLRLDIHVAVAHCTRNDRVYEAHA